MNGPGPTLAAPQAELAARLAFVAEADRLKSVDRASTLADGSRRENSAEHSWHVALWTLIFEEEIRARDADPDRVITMLLLHDLVEVDAGDHPIHLPRDEPAIAAAEALAADRLYGLLPRAQGAALRALWEEFETGQGADARAARMLDCSQPLFQELLRDDLSVIDRDVMRAILTTGRSAPLADDWPELHGHAMALLDRRPPDSSPDFRHRLAFAVEADRLKTVSRGTTLFDGSRRERSGEHSWHVALMALVLAPHADVPADVARAVRMLLVHDIVEIDAGDNPIHGSFDAAEVERAERKAADRLYGMLPERAGAALRALWDEFEAARTADALWGKAIDRVQPVLANLAAGGGSWRDYPVDMAKMEGRVGAKVKKGAPEIWNALLPDIRAWFAVNRP
ncbi:HD domain-containing protein [Wenxinia saemankumensis]|uniref:5'-deoxynucleotidase n=1 Tax=Wenxinia saemankumensis TaxID=1447782 RepID=A0A1M6H2R0_9RHOB|nr:HD domain-containing protein [Wenxinia saemankumensis]SHJ16491.1 putative hydrolases of HD superfamily [Wenxinia saemankumensis]